MPDPSLLTFLLAMTALTLAPGADTLLVIRNTLKGGSRQGDISALGICCGLFVHAGLSAGGISLILLRSATAFSLIKILGALYLVWLGIRSLRAALAPSPAIATETAAEKKHPACGKSAARAFREGFLSNVLNPKTAVFYMAFLPQFIRQEDPVFLKSMLLAGLHFILALVWLCIVAHGLHRMRGFFRNAAFTRWMEGISGGILVGFGIRLGFARNIV